MAHSPSPPPVDRDKVTEYSRILSELKEELKKLIVGQEEVVDQVLAAILAEGHCLLVGVPGLAKTLMVRSLAGLLSLDFKRIQFTPDLMPSDITGTTLIRTDAVSERGFHFLRGPIFANIILADEINRTPPKTQAALMEAMEERQVTAGGQRLPLGRPFFVLATQNPIEQEGTYPLPVSQLDRFLLKIHVDYPTEDEEFRVVLRTTSSYDAKLEPRLGREQMREIIDLVQRTVVSGSILDYAASIVRQTRPQSTEAPPFVQKSIAWGAGPRAVQAMIMGSKSLAFLDGRTEVTVDDIHQIARPVLRHRLVLSFHAEAEGIDPDSLVDQILVGLGRYELPQDETQSPRKGLLARLIRK